MVEEQLGANHLSTRSVEADYVEVVFARSADEAARYRDLLCAGSIPARIEGTMSFRRSSGVAVLVPVAKMIEATEFLAARDEEEEPESDDDDSFVFDDDDGDSDDDFDDDDDDDLDDDDDDDDDDDLFDDDDEEF